MHLALSKDLHRFNLETIHYFNFAYVKNLPVKVTFSNSLGYDHLRQLVGPGLRVPELTWVLELDNSRIENVSQQVNRRKFIVKFHMKHPSAYQSN